MPSLKELELKGKRVLLRSELNVPLDPRGRIADSTRLEASLPTIKYLLEEGAKLVVIAHLGKPQGSLNPAYSLACLASALADKLKQPVIFGEKSASLENLKTASELKGGQVMLLENLRFNKGEISNDPAFAEKLAAFGQVYINDAFGVSHRTHASVVALPTLFKEKAAGLLMEKEIAQLRRVTDKVQRPFCVILGGVKVADKIKLIEHILPKVDSLLVGGAMAYTFLKAQGARLGKSLVDTQTLPLAEKLLKRAKELNLAFLLPVDHRSAKNVDFEKGCLHEVEDSEGSIPSQNQGVDLGKKTLQLYCQKIQEARTVLWNGPMGIFEIEEAAHGTLGIAKAMAQSKGFTLVGGGDSVAALEKAKCAASVDFISTGGGATLAFLEGSALPGLKALEGP